MEQTLPDNEILLDLLVSRATRGLGPVESEELERLLAAQPDVAPDAFEHAAAAAAVVFVRADRQREPMPLELKQQIVRRGHSSLTAPDGGNVVSLRERREGGPRGSDQVGRPWLSFAALGWYAAAALALVLVLPGPQPGTVALTEQRAALVAEAADTITLPWLKSEQPGYERVAGDVVWSDTHQKGFLRLVGLPRNEPAVAQYQLWIIDPSRDEQPVDGGVFDVTVAGEVIVPIDAKLAIVAPKAFALTLEQPGGVVVSDGPLLVVASAGPRGG